MEWYYAERKKPFGPVNDEEFLSLIEKGTIMPDTLVWRPGMKEWKPLSEINLTELSASTEKKAETLEMPETEVSKEIETEYESVDEIETCFKCGQELDKKEMIFLRNQWICPSCNALSTDKPHETSIGERKLQYADFWVRAGAKIIDIFILSAIGIFVSSILGLFISPNYDPEVSMAFPFLINFFQMIIAVSYTTYFLGKYAATPGKMVCHLKVVTPDGGKISYSQAFFRYFAEIVSSLIFCIGYLMAIFDIERRTLHDRIAGTRVVKHH